MTQAKKPFTITLLGLTESERRVVKSLCMLSRSRPRSYHVLQQPDDPTRADIWIVDGKNRAAMDALEAIRTQQRLPAIIVDNHQPSSDDESCIGRPIVASRLLGALDLLVTKALDYFPELIIGDGNGNLVTATREQLTQAMQKRLPTRRHTALVVDDSVTIRKQVELALRLQEVEAVCVESAEAAEKLLIANQFDLIFLDVVLPGGADGYQICRAIKKSPDHKDTPVIMLTGKSSPFDRVRGSLAGCDTYLIKPVENQTFNAVLKKYLKSPKVALAV